MPADRRTAPTKPVKTERTHEENQERAYIAASRRSDRSLEARIESARRASEIHKKRTGRGLRVTEQDVVNEEMYEEEDEDLPTQYQRLSAHLHTGSLIFNRKLHDYIATQYGVRNAFLQQYSNPPFPGFGPQTTSNAAQYSPMQSPQTQQTQSPYQMLPPNMFGQASQSFNQNVPPMSPTGYQQPQHSYRQSPYTIPQRQQSHQRSTSISTQQQTNGMQSPKQLYAAADVQGDEQRRFSLSTQPLESSSYQNAEDGSRAALLRSTSSDSIKHQQHPDSPQISFAGTPATPSSVHGLSVQQTKTSSSLYQFMPMNYGPSSQVLNMNPLSMSLPSESQQFLGATLDPNDPRTPIFMAGSEYLPQPFGKYTYNPNISPKASRTDDTATPAMTPIKLETSLDNAPSPYPHSATSDGMSSIMMIPGSYEFPSLFDEQASQEEFDDTAFENAFINTEVWQEN